MKDDKILSEIDRRLVKIENKVYGITFCDNCGKKGKFQTGTNKYGNIGTWCSNKCELEFTHNKVHNDMKRGE